MMIDDLNTTGNEYISSYGARMSDSIFDALREMIYKECGITLSESKKILLSTRLYKRLKSLKLVCFKEYYQYLNSHAGKKSELELMINEITTNKTEFFRESAHFDILVERVLPEIISKNPDYVINLWSAGCSTGEEPYTLAMVLLNYFMKEKGDFSILASDICTSVLDKAENGIYTAKDIADISSEMKFKYLMHGTGDNKGLFKIVPEIRTKIDFLKLNLKDTFDLQNKMHIIFCRNVIIYFDHETQVELFKKFYDQLVPGGYMFIGHSETLNRVNKDFKFIAPSVYQKPE